jgi:hypothetical protein
MHNAEEVNWTGFEYAVSESDQYTTVDVYPLLNDEGLPTCNVKPTTERDGAKKICSFSRVRTEFQFSLIMNPSEQVSHSSTTRQTRYATSCLFTWH